MRTCRVKRRGPLDKSRKVGQLGKNIIGWRAVNRWRKTQRIDPGGVHAEPFCSDDIILKTIPNKEALGGGDADLLAGGEEDFRARFSDSDFGGDNDRLKTVIDPFPRQDLVDGVGVVEVGDKADSVFFFQAKEHLTHRRGAFQAKRDPG